MPLVTCPIRDYAQRFPDAVAIATLKESYSYATLDRRIGDYQVWLHDLVKTGTPVGLYAQMDVDNIAFFWAMLREGIPVFFPHLRYTMAQLAPYFAQAGIQTVFGNFFPGGVPLTAPHQTANTEATFSVDQIATYLMTSGSSGAPKLAVHTLGNHMYSALGVTQHLNFCAADTWLLSLPFYHVSGLGIVFRVFFSGATLLLPEAQGPLQYTIAALQPSHLSLVPYQLKQLDIDPITRGKIRAILLGGSQCPAPLIHHHREKGLPILKSYGMTEMASTITCEAPNAMAADMDLSDGKLLANRAIKIMDNGEIAVQGKPLFQGYLDSYITRQSTHDGWFLTGDLGYYDEYLTVTGRKDALIVSGGENIQPEEIENLLLGIPEIQQVCVVGIGDPEFGQRPVAFIAPLLPQKTLHTALEQLPRYKWPIRFLQFPFEGKPSRHLLRQHAESLYNTHS